MLLASSDAFARDPRGVLRMVVDRAGDRTDSLRRLAHSLAAHGAITFRNEAFPVSPRFDAASTCSIDRGLVPWLGVRPYGVHLCAYSRSRDGIEAWVAVRSKAKSFPGAWDNTVAGGQPAGLSLLDNVIKECAEEASIPRELAAGAVLVDEITYVREDETGLKPDTLFCFDLEVPPDFQPAPNDGEVERFFRVPMPELAEAIAQGPICKPNCALVWTSFLLRHGGLAHAPQRDRDELARLLRTPLP